ncbi:MAG: HlyC/CorC family transporter [Deltaproteobacteria bacterium]|nr:HlyC/CorC family transporter [Deltaproteobacteria bacterium]
MEIDLPLRLILLLLLLGVLVFFASSEAALFSLGRLRLQKLKEEGHPRYRVLERLLSQPRRLIISLLIGNESANVAISVLTSALFIGLWGDAAKWVAIPVTVFVILLAAEVIPKTIAVHHPERIAPAIARPVERYASVLAPLRWSIHKIVDSVLRLAGMKFDALPASFTEAEFKALVETGQEEGTVEEGERNLIHRVFAFSDQTVRNIMTPGSAVFSLPVTAGLDEAVEALRMHRFSRVPVYNDRHRIVGVLYAKDLLAALNGGGGNLGDGLKAFLRKPSFVPLSMKLDDLFREFQRQRKHLAIVVDEYGGMAGLITLEDLLEELFGEIYDELDMERQGRGRSRAPRRREARP